MLEFTIDILEDGTIASYDVSIVIHIHAFMKSLPIIFY